MWIDEFFELLYSKDGKKIEKAYDLKNEKMPEFLYKYRSIDENDYTFDLLEKDLIFLSNANNLNDLYEGELFYDANEIFYTIFDKQQVIDIFFKELNFNDKEKERVLNSKKPYLELQKLMNERYSSVNKDNFSFDKLNKSLFEIALGRINKIFQNHNNSSKGVCKIL